MWVKHPTSDMDGEIVIAGPRGPIARKMVSGVFDWPDELPLHNAYKPASAPAELILAQREADVERLRAEAAKFGLQLFAPDDSESGAEAPAADDVPAVKPKTPKPRTPASKE